MNYVSARGAEMFLRRYRAGSVALGRPVHAGPPYVCCSGLVMVAGPGTIPFLDTNSRFLSLFLHLSFFSSHFLSVSFCLLCSSRFCSLFLPLSRFCSLLFLFLTSAHLSRPLFHSCPLFLPGSHFCRFVSFSFSPLLTPFSSLSLLVSFSFRLLLSCFFLCLIFARLSLPRFRSHLRSPPVSSSHPLFLPFSILFILSLSALPRNKINAARP